MGRVVTEVTEKKTGLIITSVSLILDFLVLLLLLQEYGLETFSLSRKDLTCV